MLPCTKSYVSISILKKMLTCIPCGKRVQNPHFYTACKDHFFCFNCKGDGVTCPVCQKALTDSDLVRDLFLDDVLRTSCFTIHDKDFEREKVPLHLVNKLFDEFDQIDKARLEGFATKNHLKSPLKVPLQSPLKTPSKTSKENATTKKAAGKSTVQTKLDFFSGKKGTTPPVGKKSNDTTKLNDGVRKVGLGKNPTKSRVAAKFKLDDSFEETLELVKRKSLEEIASDFEAVKNTSDQSKKKVGGGKNQTTKSRFSTNSKSEDSFESVKRKSTETVASSDTEAVKNISNLRRSQSKESVNEQLKNETPSDSQSLFKTQKQRKKSVAKIPSEPKEETSKRATKPSKREINDEEKETKSVLEDGAEKKKARQSSGLNTSQISRRDTVMNVNRRSKDNCDKSILERDKKAKNVFKKNAKGETALHIASRTNKLSQLKELLETDWKLHINDKDFAGWTPLHEAVTSGSYEISKILLEAGAWVFVPGYNFETPLHTALYKTEDLVKLIMNYGPDVEAKTITGQTPLSIAKELGLENLLQSSVKPVDLPTPPPMTPTVICFHDRNMCNKNVAASLSKLDISVANNFSKDISHLVVKTNDSNVCESSMTVLEAMLLGKCLLNAKWIDDSIDAGMAVECEQFEVSGVGNASEAGLHAPYKARLNAYRLFPGLFAGAFFYLVGNWRDSAKREKVTSLINAGGGAILKREPDPENIPDNEKTVMYHTKPDTGMGKCSHILLYNEESDGPQLKYRMEHIKTLPLKWLITCIETFSIIDPE